MTKFVQLTNYDDIKELADNPMQMATRILALERRAAEWSIGNDPKTRGGMLEQLKSLVVQARNNPEQAHQEADDLLLEYINDAEVSALYGQIEKYYS